MNPKKHIHSSVFSVYSVVSKCPSPIRAIRGQSSSRAGMTMVELGIVMGIVSVLFALVLGLASHVDAAVKIRRAQADLGEWHESLNRWFLQFGEYPHARIDTTQQEPPTELFSNPNWNFADTRNHPLTILTNEISGCYIRFDYNNTHTNITFRSYLTSSVSTIDPWGMPYIYIPSDNAKAYTLFSCGPNRQTLIEGQRVPSAASDINLAPALDDIYFER